MRNYNKDININYKAVTGNMVAIRAVGTHNTGNSREPSDRDDDDKEEWQEHYHGQHGGDQFSCLVSNSSEPSDIDDVDKEEWQEHHLGNMSAIRTVGHTRDNSSEPSEKVGPNREMIMAIRRRKTTALENMMTLKQKFK